MKLPKTCCNFGTCLGAKNKNKLSYLKTNVLSQLVTSLFIKLLYHATPDTAFQFSSIMLSTLKCMWMWYTNLTNGHCFTTHSISS